MLFVLTLLFAQTVAPPAISNTTVRTAVACDPTKFITRAYQDVLGRPIDAAGQAYWLGQMKNGVTRTQVANQLVRSVEHSNARIQNMFSTYLHRPAGGTDINFYSGMLQHGTPVEDVRSSILASPEYFNSRGGGGNIGFVTALYQDVLGRAPDAQGSSSFVQALNTGAQRSAIAHQFVTSQEARARWMNALYNTYLHHGAPGGGASGGEDQVAVAILASEEYCRR